MFFDVSFNNSKHLIIEATCWYEAQQIYLDRAFGNKEFSDIIKIDDLKKYLLYNLHSEELNENDLIFDIKKCDKCSNYDTEYCPYANKELDFDIYGYINHSYHTKNSNVCEKYDNPLEKYEVVRKSEYTIECK